MSENVLALFTSFWAI